MRKKSSRGTADGNGTSPDGESAARYDTPAGEPASAAPVQPAPVINLNTASVDELRQLRGIGPALAERIIQYRSSNGPFATTAGILRVPGISQATYEAIAAVISAGSPGPAEQNLVDGRASATASDMAEAPASPGASAPALGPIEEAAAIAAAAAPEPQLIEPAKPAPAPEHAPASQTQTVENLPPVVALYDTPAANAAPEQPPTVPDGPIMAANVAPAPAAQTPPPSSPTAAPSIPAPASSVPPQMAQNALPAAPTPALAYIAPRELPHAGAPMPVAPAPSSRPARDWTGLMTMTVLGAILGAVLALLAVAGLNQGTLLLNERPEVVALTNQLDQQRSRADALQTEADSLRARLDALEGLSNRVSGLEANVAQAKAALDNLQAQTSALGQRTTALESQLSVVRAAVDRFDGFLTGLRALVDQAAPTPTGTPTQAPSSTPTLAPSATATNTTRPSDTPLPTSSAAPSQTPAPTTTSAPSTATVAASLTVAASSTPVATSAAAATATRTPPASNTAAASHTPVK